MERELQTTDASGNPGLHVAPGDNACKLDLAVSRGYKLSCLQAGGDGGTMQGFPRITAVDLFCGVGGLTNGLISAGIAVKAGVDTDAACRFAYEANNPGAEYIRCDVAELGAGKVRDLLAGGDFTMLAGCAPCQPFSSYSRTGRTPRGSAGAGLAGRFGMLLQEVRPHFAVLENVRAFSRHEVLDAFKKCLDGYHVWAAVVACSTVGVPQTRKRFVLLASRLGPDGLALPVLPGPAVTVRDTIGHLPRLAAGQACPDDPLHVACSLSVTNLARIRASTPGGTWRDWPPLMRADCHLQEKGGTFCSVYGRMEWDAPAPTMTTQCFGYGNGRFGHPEQDRAISLREAAMLQTFPPGYQFVAPGKKPSFATIGRQIGNAVPVRLGEAIGRTLVAHAMLHAEDRLAA